MVNGSLFIYGGEDASRRPVSDLYVLDLASMAWREVATTGRAPAARSAHAAVPYKVRCIDGIRDYAVQGLLQLTDNMERVSNSNRALLFPQAAASSQCFN